MRELTNTQNYIFLAGAVLMVIGAGCAVFGFATKVTSLVFAFGTICFALMQMSQVYTGTDLTLRRLRHLMVIGDICFILSGLLMVENEYHLIYPFMASTIDGKNNYAHFVHNNWVVALLIAAIIEIYTTHRISYVLNKLDNDKKS